MAAVKKKKSRGLLYTMLIIIAIELLAIYKTFGPNTGSLTKGDFFYLHTGSDYDRLRSGIEEGGFVSDMVTFNWLAKLAGLPAHVHPGKYKIGSGMSNFNIIRMLRSGRQTPVKLLVNRLRTKHDFVMLLSSNLEADSLAVAQLMNDQQYLSQFGFDTNTVMCAILPDTYDFYWDVTADKAFRKIHKNYTRFWDENRRQLARSQGLNPVKTIIIASIVEEETNLADDKPKIASVYMNRLDKGMKLQADPTVKFAIGDFSIRRITGPMLDTKSPYNTYMYAGLPPGPICTPTTSSIEAVLTAPKTSYLYFCADEDFSGHSTFASTYPEQIKNAHAYQKALDARGIH
jgi:peptidoglycan lytic transglycosylase G